MSVVDISDVMNVVVVVVVVVVVEGIYYVIDSMTVTGDEGVCQQFCLSLVPSYYFIEDKVKAGSSV